MFLYLFIFFKHPIMITFRKKENVNERHIPAGTKLIDSDAAEDIDERNVETTQLWRIPMAKRSDGKVTKGTVIKALYMGNGVVTVAARALGVNRKSIYRWIEENKEIKLAFEDARACTADFAENKLIECISRKHQWAIELALKYRGDFNEESIIKRSNKGSILDAIDTMLGDEDDGEKKHK